VVVILKILQVEAAKIDRLDLKVVDDIFLVVIVVQEIALVLVASAEDKTINLVSLSFDQKTDVGFVAPGGQEDVFLALLLEKKLRTGVSLLFSLKRNVTSGNRAFMEEIAPHRNGY
jgi:hypothetical protein